MKCSLFIAVVSLVSMAGSTVHSGEYGHGEKNMVVGGYFSPGIGMVVGDGYEEVYPLLVDREDRTAIFAMGTNGYFDYYFTPIIGIEGGIGFLSMGIRFAPATGVNFRRERVVYMEIPFLFKLDIHHFQLTAGFAIFVALAGKTTTATDDERTDSRWRSDEWEVIRRANLGSHITFSYAIPVGPIFIVPGITWIIHFINDLNNNEIPGNDNFQMRATNLMFNAGVEWAF